MCIWVLCLLCLWGSLFVTKRWKAPSFICSRNDSSPNSCHLRCKREHNPCGAAEGQEHGTIIGQMVSLASRMENVKTPITIEIEHFVCTAAWVDTSSAYFSSSSQYPWSMSWNPPSSSLPSLWPMDQKACRSLSLSLPNDRVPGCALTPPLRNHPCWDISPTAADRHGVLSEAGCHCGKAQS